MAKHQGTNTMSINQARVTVIGGGLDFSRHPSAESCRALRNSKTVFHAGCHHSVAQWLADLAKDAQVIDIDEDFYEIGQYRPDMYRAMAQKVVLAALEGGEVALIEPGSAMVTDLVTPFVLEAARAAGVETRIIPGISCLEHLFIAFGVDPSSGLQVILAQELVAQRARLNPQFDTVVIQPGYFDTLWCAGWPKSGPERFDALIETLGLSFGPEQPMVLVRFAMHPGDVTHSFWFAMEDLARLAPLMTPLHTLFVPAADKADRDPAFQQRMHQWERSIAYFQRGPGGAPLQLDPVTSNLDLALIEQALDADLVSRSRALEGSWRKSGRVGSTSRIDPAVTSLAAY